MPCPFRWSPLRNSATEWGGPQKRPGRGDNGPVCNSYTGCRLGRGRVGLIPSQYSGSTAHHTLQVTAVSTYVPVAYSHTYSSYLHVVVHREPDVARDGVAPVSNAGAPWGLHPCTAPFAPYLGPRLTFAGALKRL